MPEIIVKLGDKIVQKVLLMQNQKLTVGRAPDNDIAVENPAVSRRHTSIQQLNGRYILEDLNSANGTYVNGVRVSKTEILDRDVITIGKHKLHFYNEVAGAAASGSDEKPAPAGGMPTAVLRITQGKQRDQVFDLNKVETTIGRAQENDVRLHDWFVSKFHAVIGRRGGQFIIRDLDSWRHTMVNGEVVQERALQNGDEIMFGLKTAMRFELKNAAGVAPGGSGRLPVELEGGAAEGEPFSTGVPAAGAAEAPSNVALPPGPAHSWDDKEAPINMAMAAVDDHGKAGPPPAFLEGVSGDFEVKVDDFELHQDPPTPSRQVPASEPEPADATVDSVPSAAAAAEEPALGAASSDEIAMWEKALQNPSRVIRKQAARALKKLTGRDYDIE